MLLRVPFQVSGACRQQRCHLQRRDIGAARRVQAQRESQFGVLCGGTGRKRDGGYLRRRSKYSLLSVGGWDAAGECLVIFPWKWRSRALMIASA